MSNADYYGFSKERVTSKDVVNATERAAANDDIQKIKEKMMEFNSRLDTLEEKYNDLLLETRKLAIK